MWVFEEEVNGQKLSEVINTTHENVKYLPGFLFMFVDIIGGVGQPFFFPFFVD